MSDETTTKTGEEQVAEAVREVFSPASIPTLGNTIRKRWLQIPEWGNAWVCVWGTTLQDRSAIEDDAALAGENLRKAAMRRQVSSVIAACYDGDGPDAKRLFNHKDHWGWMTAQPASVLDAIFGTVADLDAGGAARAAAEEVFGLPELRAEIATLRACLSSIASASECCTDCPRNSLPTCLLQPSTPPSPPTES